MTLLFDAIISLGPRLRNLIASSDLENAPEALEPTCGSLPVDATPVKRWPRASPHMHKRSVRPDNRLVERMLADPMTRLVMKADGVSDAEIRSLYGTATSPTHSAPGFRYQASKHVPLPDAGPRPGSSRPHIGE